MSDELRDAVTDAIEGCWSPDRPVVAMRVDARLAAHAVLALPEIERALRITAAVDACQTDDRDLWAEDVFWPMTAASEWHPGARPLLARLRDAGES